MRPLEDNLVAKPLHKMHQIDRQPLAKFSGDTHHQLFSCLSSSCETFLGSLTIIAHAQVTPHSFDTVSNFFIKVESGADQPFVHCDNNILIAISLVSLNLILKR